MKPTGMYTSIDMARDIFCLVAEQCIKPIERTWRQLRYQRWSNLSIVILVALEIVQLAESRPVRRDNDQMRHRRFAQTPQGYLITLALSDCKIPPPCAKSVEKSLYEQRQVPNCEETDYHQMMDCLDHVILSRTNATHLTSKAGKVCCDAISGVSLECQVACRSALYSPTLSHDKKRSRIQTVCDKFDEGGDAKALHCLKTAPLWLSVKHRM
ncbi:hypothetical protein Ddc_02812 [Ditylenchus destructor]|nr:hypothetical protein Ddc_02812 [Ditylenchus destructor]